MAYRQMQQAIYTNYNLSHYTLIRRHLGIYGNSLLSASFTNLLHFRAILFLTAHARGR